MFAEGSLVGSAKKLVSGRLRNLLVQQEISIFYPASEPVFNLLELSWQ